LTYKYIAFYKPYGVLSQFSGEGRTLSDFNLPTEVYAAGRLDKDSEGLLVLTNDGPFIKKLTDPKSQKDKIYWVQVEGEPDSKSINQLKLGVTIKGKKTRPCQAKLLETTYVEEFIQERDPPVRFRAKIPTSWVEIILNEGMNRQVRRMCAAVGFPCLRLIRRQVGLYKINSLKEGEWISVKRNEILLI
jgi:23S rRNA pseudouridine2457 synthase